jgi:hypothetical protein
MLNLYTALKGFLNIASSVDYDQCIVESIINS